MGNMKMELKRTAIAVLTFALLCMFMMPVQVFAEDSVGGDTAAQESGTETGNGEVSSVEMISNESGSGTTEAVQSETSSDTAAPSTGAAYLAPSNEPTDAGNSGNTADNGTATTEAVTTGTDISDSSSNGAAEEGTAGTGDAGTSGTTDSSSTGAAEEGTAGTGDVGTSGTTESSSTGVADEGTTGTGDDTTPVNTQSGPIGTPEDGTTGSDDNSPEGIADNGVAACNEVDTTAITDDAAVTSAGMAASGTADGEWKRYDNNDSANAIQQAVDAAINAGQKYITVVVQDGTYTGGLSIDNSGKESIVVNIVAHDAYKHSEPQTDGNTQNTDSAASAPNAVYPVPTNSDGTVDTSAINSGSAGGVKLEGGVSVKNVELLLAGIYLSLREKKEDQGKLESMATNEGNVDVVVEDADSFTYYGTTKNDTANIKLKDVEHTTIDTGEGDDELNVSSTISGNVQLDTTQQDSTLKDTFDAADTVDSSIAITAGSGNDKITVTETSSVTNEDSVVSVRKGKNTLNVSAGDGADTITLNGGTKLVDIKKNIDQTTAERVYAIVCRDILGHGSTARIEGGAGDDQLNLDTTWELGSLGKTELEYIGGEGKNRLHLTGTLAEKDDRVSGALNAENGNGYISLYSSNTASRTDYRLIDTNLLINKKITDLTLQSAIPMHIQMHGVDTLTDDLSGKKTVDVTIKNGKVMAGEQEVVFQPFTDYVYAPEGDKLSVPSFSNASATGLLVKMILRGQNLTVGENVIIQIPGATLMLESVNGTESGGKIVIQGHLEAENIMLKLVSSDSHAISFVEQEGDTPSILDFNTSAAVTIASTAKLIATRMVDILAKSIQNNGLLPDLTELIPGLDTLTESQKTEKINEYVKKAFGFDSLEMLKQAASINFISIKIASAVVEILGNIIAGSVRVAASNQVDTTAANSALRDLGLPFALGVIVGEAGIKIFDSASITANNGDIYLDAQSDIKVNTTALSGRLPYTLAVSVVDNKAYVDISGGQLTSTKGNLIANASGTVNIKTSATGSNVRPNNNAVVPSTDHQASNTTTHVEMGKSGGFFAISVLTQDVFSALKGTASANAKQGIALTSTAKASVVNNAASNPGEDGESMTLVKLLKTLAGDEEVESDGGIVGKIRKAVNGYYDKKANQTTSQEEKAELEKKKEKRTSALGSFLDKLTGNADDSEGDDVASLVDKATSSANSGKTDSTHTVQLVGALAVTYASNNNRAYIETAGEVVTEGKLSVTANGEMKVDTLADGSPVKADDPAGGDKKTGPKDQHYNEHSHGVIKVDALTNGTIIMDASIGQNEDGTCEVVENDNFPKGIDAFEDFNFVVKACFGYKLAADENGKYWITNEYIRDSDNAKKTEKIEVILVGKDADGCYLYKSADGGYGGVRVNNGTNVFKAEFVPKNSITVDISAPQLGTVEVTDAQSDGRTLYFADQGEDVYVKVNIKSGVVNFTTPYVTYKVAGSDLVQPVTVTDIIKGDVQEDGTLDYYYGFKMPEGDVTIHVVLNGDAMNIKLDLADPAERISDVWITTAENNPTGEAMEKDSVYTGKVGDKIKIVIQLPKNTFLVKNSLMFAGKTPVYIKDITYDGENQYTCFVNIPAILKTEGDETAGTELKLTFQTTLDPKEAQGTIESTSTALGAGLAVDVTRYNNQAYITKVQNNHLTAGSVAVKANTAELSASAESKAGFVAGDLGVAGAITVHLVSVNNEALIGGDIQILTLNGGDLVLESTIQNSAIKTNAIAAGNGADGKDVDPNSVGVGAGIAVGVTNLAVVSRIQDSVIVDGSIANLTINASHSGTESMSASAGASGGTSAVPVLAMNISGVSVLADSGRKLDNVLRLSGDVLVKAANSIIRTITADAAAVGGGVGVGSSFIIDILNDSAKAKLGRSVHNNGNITVSADSVSRLKATAKSGAQGSVSKEDGKNSAGDSGNGSGASGEEPPPSGGSDNKVTLPDDYYEGLDDLFGEGSSDNELTEEDDPESLAPLFREGEADQFVDSNKQSAQDLSSLVSNNNGNVNAQNVGDAFENRQKAETSEGSVQVAATMVLNVQSNAALAEIDMVNSIISNGKVSVTARHDTDGVIMANASATKSTTGVGVAVAINTVSYSNVAGIHTDNITANEVLVQATVYEAEAEKTAEGFFEAIKNDVLSTTDKIHNFVDDVLNASKKGNLVTFIRTYLGNYAVENASEMENAIVQLILQWIGELLQGKTPSFPTSKQEDKVKEQVTEYAKGIFEKVKKDFSVKKLKEAIFGKDGLLGTLKKKTKDINLREMAVNAVIGYLSGKLGGNEEAEGVGPRISTSAVSGAGASNVGVAGSVAISVVNGISKAYIDQAENGKLNVTGNVTVESKASQDVYTSAGASVDALGQVDKNKNATDTANSTQGGASNADSGKSVGVGAAVAMSFAELTSDAGIGSGWTIQAKDLQMTSAAENNVETTSVSGTDPLARTEEPTDKTDKDLTEEEKAAKEKEEAEKKAAEAMDHAVDASVSVTLIQNTVKTSLAENSVMNLSGNLKMLSSQSGETNTNASGFAMGNETAVGAAVAINLAFSDVLTQLLSGGTVAGTAILDAITENQDDANALAMAMGADMDRYFAKLRNAEKVMAFNKKKEEEKKDEEDKKEEGKEEDKKDEEKADDKIENETGNKISDQLKRASNVSGKKSEDKSDPSQPLSVQAIKSQNVKTESTNQTDASKNSSVGSSVTDATNSGTGSAVSDTLNQQAQEGQSIHVAASVGVNVTEHIARIVMMRNLIVGGLKAEAENTGNFSTASTGAAISEATNSNCVGAAVAVSANGNKAIIEISDDVTIVVTGNPGSDEGKNADPILGNVELSTALNQNSTGEALGRYGVLAISGSSSGKGGKVGLAGSVAVLIAKGISAILIGDNVTITGSENGTVSIHAADKSKLSAAAMAATKSGGAAAGVGASFALLYAKNEVLAQAGNNFTVSAKDFSMTATKQVVDITDFKPDAAVSDFISVLEVDEKGNGGYKTEDADKYGLIVLQKNQNGSYSLFTNLNTADILSLIQLTSVLASVNYYASAVAGTVMERKGDTSNQKLAVAGAISMLFNDSVTRVLLGDHANITTTGVAKLNASSETNTRLLGGALSSSSAKAGIGLNVATAKQNDTVCVTLGNAPVITADSFSMNAESVSELLVITAAAVNASGTSVGGALNVVINDTGAKVILGDNATILASGPVDIISNVTSNVTLGSVTVSISGSQNQGASAGAIVSVSTNASAAEALVGDNAVITSNSDTIVISADNAEQVISVLAAAARSGNGGAGAGTVSVLTTDAKALAEVGDHAKLTAVKDIVVRAMSRAKLIDVMLAAAASTDAPAVGATIMVNVFNRDTRASIGDSSVVISKLGNVLVQANSDETAVIISVAGAAASQNAISGNIQVNVGSSTTGATIGNNAVVKAWDSIGVTADHNSTLVAVSPTVTLGSNSTAVGATVQTNILGSTVKALIGDNANLIAYAQNSVTGGVQTSNRESKRKGIVLSALARDLVVAGGISASAGKNAVSGVVETFVNKIIVIAKLGANAVVTSGFQSGAAMDDAFAWNTASEQEGELSAGADAHSTLVLFGGAFSATSSTGVGATVLTLVYDQNVDAQILLSNTVLSRVNGNVNVTARAENLVALVSVNFGVSNNTAANVGGNVLIFQNQVNAKLSGNLAASGDVNVMADSITDLINAIASASGSLDGASVSGAALVTYFQGTTVASVGTGSRIEAFALYVLASSTANIHSDGVGLTASVGSAAVSGLVNVIVTSTATSAFVGSGSTVVANYVTVMATDHYDLLAIAVSLSGGSNGIGVTAVVTVAKNTVLAYIGDNTTVHSAALIVKAISNRNIRNYAGSVAAGVSAGVGVTVMVAVIGGKLDQDSANSIAKGFKPDAFMKGIQVSVPNAAKKYLTKLDLSADIAADDAKASDLHVGDKNGNYNGTDDYRSDDFDKQYNSGTNPGENFSEDVTNTQGSELGMNKPAGEYRNVISAYIGCGSQITVSGSALIEANEKLNIDIVTASAAVGGAVGINVGVAVVVAYSNVLAEVRTGTVLDCGDVTVRAVSGGDGSIDSQKASDVLAAAGMDVSAAGSSIRVIAITVGIGATAGVSPSVAVVNMASSAMARMDGVNGTAKVIQVKAETVYPNVLAVTGAIGAGGSAGISTSAAVVTFNSSTYAGITNSDLSAAELSVSSNVDNTAKAYAMSLAGGGVGVNGGVAVVANRSTTTTVVSGGRYTVYGDVTVSSVVNTNAESYIVGLALGGVAVGLNAAVVNQHANIVTQVLGDSASSLTASGNVTVSNGITATAKSTVISTVGGGIGVGGNVLLVFNNMNATAAMIHMPFTVTGNVTVSANMKADSVANLASATVGGVAVGISTSYVGLNARNKAYLELPEGAVAKAASIRVYAGSADDKNSFNAAATTVAGCAGIVNVGLNAAVADIHATNEAKILSKGTLVGSVDVQANANAAALAEIYFASAGGVNVSAATAVSLLRISQMAEADIAAIDSFAELTVSSGLNVGPGSTASHAKLVTVSGGIVNASANVAVAYSLSRNVAKAILHNGTNGGNITVMAHGSADAKSETLNQSTGVFSGSVYVNVAYAKGQFQSLLQVLNQVSANNAQIQTIYTTNSYAYLTPSASKLDLSLASFNVNLAIARSAAKAMAALEGTGKLVLVQNLLVKADGSNSSALADIIGAVVNVSGFNFGVNIADSQMALEQTVSVSHVSVDAGGRIEIYGNADNLSSTAQTGANSGVGISIAGSKVNTANANASAVNQVVLDSTKLNATNGVTAKANSAGFAVKAIAKALSFELSGINAAVTATEAKVTKFHTGVFLNNVTITGSNVEASASANGTQVVSQSSVPRFSGSIIGVDSILATARILEKLTQVIVNGSRLQATGDVILSANADAALKAGSAHPATSVGAISVKDYRFNIEVEKILTEVLFDGQIEAYDVTLTAFDSITGDIRMDDATVGGFTGATGVAKITVKNQTAYVKTAGSLKATGNIFIEAWADQKLAAIVDNDSTNVLDRGYAQTDIIVYRNAIVDVSGELISQRGNIDVKAQLDSSHDNDRVIHIDLDIALDTWIDLSSYPTATGKLVSVAKVTVAEGSLIQALNVFDGDEAGTVSIESKSEGKVLVDVYRYVDKPWGGNETYAISDVSETVQTNIGGSAKTRINGRNIYIRARTEMDVRSKSYAKSNTTLLNWYYPNATVIFRVDLDTIIHAADINAQNILNISAYLLSTYVFGHSISEKVHKPNVNSPSVTIKGNIYGDVTFDVNTVLRANELNIKAFHPNDYNKDNQLKIERRAECVYKQTHTFDENTVFDTNSAETNTKYNDPATWAQFSQEKKFIRGTYKPEAKKENNIYYSGNIRWNSASLSGQTTPSGRMEIYLGAGATGIHVDIDANGNVRVIGLSDSVDPNELVYLENGVYHVDGSKLQSAVSKGNFSFKYDQWYGTHNRYDYATSGDLTLINASDKTVQLDNVNGNTGTSDHHTDLTVIQSQADTDLILNNGGNFAHGGIRVDLAGGDLKLQNGAQINAQNIIIRGVASILDQTRNDGKVLITNSSCTGKDADSSIDIMAEEALNILLQSGNSSYSIHRIQSGGDMTLTIVNTAGIKMPVLLGELISSGNVMLTVPYSVVSADSGIINITANTIVLNAGGNVGSSSEQLLIDSSINQTGGVTVISNGGIYLKEADGNLYIEEIRNESGNIAIWTQNGSIYSAVENLTTDNMELLNKYLMDYAEAAAVTSAAEDMIRVLLQYLRDLIRIQHALETEGDTALETVKQEIDLLNYATTVEEAQELIAEELLFVGGTEYQDPEIATALLKNALVDDTFTDEFRTAVEGLVENPVLGGQLGEQLVIWRNNYDVMTESLLAALLFRLVIDADNVNISSNGDLQLHLQSSSGSANVSEDNGTLSISVGGKVTITGAQNTMLQDVYLESHRELNLDPIVASRVIDLYSLDGIYAAKQSDQVLLNADSVMLWSLLSGDLGTASQALILNANLLNAYGNNVYLKNSKDLTVDTLFAMKNLELTVQGNLYDLHGDHMILTGIEGKDINLQVSGNIGAEDNTVTITSNGRLDITAENLYMTSKSDVLLGTIRTEGMVSIDASQGSIENADKNSGIWCDSLNLQAYGRIGSKESPLIIHSNGTYTSSGGGLMRAMFRFRAPAAKMPTLMANSYLYGENILIIPLKDNNVDIEDEDSQENIGNSESDIPFLKGTVITVTGSNNNRLIHITGHMAKDAVVTVMDVSEHVNCVVCQHLMENQGNGRIFVNLKLIGSYAGKLLVQISTIGDLAEHEDREIVILTCRDGKIWAVRATIVNGFITFYTDELGPFLVLGDPAQLVLTEDGTQILLDQKAYSFGGWL